MDLQFTKMHGLGNDFVVINAMDKPVSLTPEQLRYLSDRYTGIGFDQLVILQPSTNPEADVMYRVFNADGSEGGQSGNGARCIGRYIQENAIVTKDVIQAQTIKGIIHIYFEADNAIRVNMGMPRIEPNEIPIAAKQRQPFYNIDVDGTSINLFSLSMGNPHAVIIVDDIATAEVEKLGKQIQQHAMFPESVNVGFLQIVSRSQVLLRVYERGAGETLACGTGSCAAVVAGILANKLDNAVTVRLKLGKLLIKWDGEGSDVWMTGPATTIYKGQITI